MKRILGGVALLVLAGCQSSGTSAPQGKVWVDERGRVHLVEEAQAPVEGAAAPKVVTPAPPVENVSSQTVVPAELAKAKNAEPALAAEGQRVFGGESYVDNEALEARGFQPKDKRRFYEVVDADGKRWRFEETAEGAASPVGQQAPEAIGVDYLPEDWAAVTAEWPTLPAKVERKPGAVAIIFDRWMPQLTWQAATGPYEALDLETCKDPCALDVRSYVRQGTVIEPTLALRLQDGRLFTLQLKLDKLEKGSATAVSRARWLIALPSGQAETLIIMAPKHEPREIAVPSAHTREGWRKPVVRTGLRGELSVQILEPSRAEIGE